MLVLILCEYHIVARKVYNVKKNTNVYPEDRGSAFLETLAIFTRTQVVTSQKTLIFMRYENLWRRH